MDMNNPLYKQMMENDRQKMIFWGVAYHKHDKPLPEK